ncbi:hypothetical protein DL767_000897 [Monosporascus sp. MG133]|nr:hypothetical protein DL767_000897 [Monosporascus sp. MG133]
MNAPEQTRLAATDLDIVVIGAGISGINAAYRLQTQLPEATFKVLECRDEIGGTWDLFRFPGVRSDTPIFALGFEWAPWPSSHQPFADGASILSYLKDCVSRFQIDEHILLRHRLLEANWTSQTNRWNLLVHDENESCRRAYTAKFLAFATGYYDYQDPLPSHIRGLESFEGEIIHPQFWPAKCDYAGKNVTIIGSGATAVTLLPALRKDAATVTMLQRSPSYVLSTPNRPFRIPWLVSKVLPSSVIYTWIRWYHILVGYGFFLFTRYLPIYSSRLLRNAAGRQLPPWVREDLHFKPEYSPWDQRLCIAPDGDFYRALQQPNVQIKTATIERVTARAIQIHGETIPTDVIVPATGLRMRFGGGVDIKLDGVPILDTLPDRLLWHGAMLSGVPNATFMLSYGVGPWTLAVDNAAHILVRLFKFSRSRQIGYLAPELPADTVMPKLDIRPFSSTYVKEAVGTHPKYGGDGPWRPKNNPIVDYFHARWGDLTRGLRYE